MADVIVIVNPPVEPDVVVTVVPDEEPDVIVIVTQSGVSQDTVYKNDVFVAAAGETEFTLTFTAGNVIYVDINGIIQLEEDYTIVTDLLTLLFTPVEGDIINIKYTL